MANWQATNINTGTTEGSKYFEIGTINEVWQVTLGSSTATGDTISGPVIPAGVWVLDVKTAWGALGSGATQQVGYTGTTGAFIASGNTTPAAGGIQAMNVAGGLGATYTSAKTVLVTLGGTFTAASSTVLTIAVSYTANP